MRRLLTLLAVVAVSIHAVSSKAADQRRLTVKAEGDQVLDIDLESEQIARSASSLIPPGNRGNYVMSVFRNHGTSSWVKIAQYSFRTDGTIRSDYWFYQMGIYNGKSDSTRKVYDRSAAALCTIWTPYRYMDRATTAYGSYVVSGSQVVITWVTSGEKETFAIANLAAAPLTKLKLISATTGATHGIGYGSTKGFSYGVGISMISAAGKKYTGPYYERNYESFNADYTSLNIANFTYDGARDTLFLKTSDADPVHYYIGQTNNYRNIHINHAKERVNDGNICNRNGHLKAFQEIIDDSGNFRGFLGGEASLYSAEDGSAILSLTSLTDF